MRSSRPLLTPVVTLLSPSPAASRRAQEALANLFGLQELRLDLQAEQDELNAKMKWDSVVSQCPNSHAVVHWLSLEDATNEQGSFSLLSVSHRTDESNGIPRARNLLSTNFPSSMLGLKLRNFFQRPMSVDTLLKRHQGLPVLDLPTEDVLSTENSKQAVSGKFLKEVCFTVEEDALYEDGSTVFSRLSQSTLVRPVPGVYGWAQQGQPTVCLRPLPMAKQDLRSYPKPLVFTFHCESLDEVNAINAENNTPVLLSKIGYNGQGNGQLRVQIANDNPLMGLDLRWCESQKTKSAFMESQEALLASSLPELQSTNVLKATGKNEPGLDDSKLGAADCWIEVRNMVRNPRGFAPSKSPKVATAPPSYPE